MLQANGSQKKVGGASHITDKIHFKTKSDKDGLYIMIKGQKCSKKTYYLLLTYMHLT